METIKGTPITDEEVQLLADEAERGYNVDRLRRRGRRPMGDGPAKVVPVRLHDELLTTLAERAKHDHVSPFRHPRSDPRLRFVRVHASALKHGIAPEDALRAASAPVFVSDLDDDDSPARPFRLGFDGSGRLLELVVLLFDSGNS